MKNILLPIAALCIISCSTPLVKQTDLSGLEIRGRVKTLTEFTASSDDSSVVVKTVRKFNPDGNLLSEDVYRNGMHFTAMSYMYDHKGRKSQERFFHYADKIAGQTSEYRYDEKTGRILKSTVPGKGESVRTSFEFNEDGRLAEEKHFGSDGQLEFTIQSTYNKKGQLAEKKFIRLRGLAIDRYSEGYDANLKVGSGSEKARNEASANYYGFSYAYDEKGNLVTEKLVHADGTAAFEMRYQYGNPDIAEASVIEEPEECAEALPDSWKPGYLFAEGGCRPLWKSHYLLPSFDREGNWTNRYALNGNGEVARMASRVIEYY
jgi:hypothetical protein